MNTEFVGRFLRYGVSAAGLVGILSFSSAIAAPPTDDAEALARDNWSEAISNTEVPHEGCFMAEYPSTTWMPVGCIRAPNRPYVPKSGAGSQTVGNGHDYAAGVSGLLTRTMGTFPVVTGVTSETDDGVSNDYSLQLNSNFMSTAACNGHSGCLSWQQFIYSSGENAVFMQYWLINYGTPCPAGWNAFSGSCYKNSAAVFAPLLPISDLSGMKVTGRATVNKSDVVMFTGAGIAYSVSGSDHVVDLATAWQQSEFNIIGDGGGSKAVFNTGSHITVRIAVTDGSSSAPTCVANGGTTGETNNLNLGTCTGTGGTGPHIQFVEHN